MERVSIKDIARIAGVSYSTVSRALNNNPLISQEVRSRVQALAQSMGYSPNALAQGLLSRRTHSIGVIITTVSDRFFVDVLKGVEEVAKAADIGVFLAISNNDPDQEIKIIENFNRRRVDGVIVAASRLDNDYANRLEEIHIPIVVVNNQAEGDYQNLYSICVDDYAGGRLAMRHLLELGHRRIGYLGMANRPASNHRRLKAYQDALKESQITPQASWMFVDQTMTAGDLEGDIRSGQTYAPRLVEAGLTALFCYCDSVAIGAMMACRQMNIAVPREISILGFDDSDLCGIVYPPLTTIRQPKYEMGQTAMHMLLAGITNEMVEEHIVQPTLVIRESTAAPQ
jgi:LacI family transcriptional regulator/LacI family repressor for deo operon, udp, cdd, tsx, nupC, and nupG